MAQRYLNRYTDLLNLIDMLYRKQIVLLDSSKWEDKNDAYYIDRYKEKLNLKSVLVLCFTTERETFHHWKVFAGSPSGVCIRFKMNFLRQLRMDRNILIDDVKYRLIKTLKRNPPKPEELPFLKRKPFKDEKELRIIYKDDTNVMPIKYININLESIDKVILSPWMHDSVVESVVNTIKNIDGCSKIMIEKNNLVNNNDWKNLAI